MPVPAANGFFDHGVRVSEAVIAAGALDSFFRRMETLGWPTTLHCDLGCDNYDSIMPYTKRTDIGSLDTREYGMGLLKLERKLKMNSFLFCFVENILTLSSHQNLF